MSLKKESVKKLLSKAFSWNHEEETIYYMIVKNLDKINDDNVDEIAEAMSRYVYCYKGWEQAGQVLRKYNIKFDPYDNDPYAKEDEEE